MASRRELLIVPLGFLIMLFLVGMSTFIVFHMGPDVWGGSDVDRDAYPAGPEKPTPLDLSNIVEYTVTYEERLFYNDLLTSRNQNFDADERVITNCSTISASNSGTDEFRVRLECRGGIDDTSQLSESEEFTYSVTYWITDKTTQRTEMHNYPFGTDRTFNNERN